MAVSVSGDVMAVRAVAEVGSHKRTAQGAQLVGGEFVGGDGGADVGHEAGTCGADGVGCGLCGVTDPGKLNAGDHPVLRTPDM